MIQTETLNLLEWSRLCEHVATFAATKLGAIATRNLTIPSHRDASEALLTQTAEVDHLESQLTTSLTFDGVRDISKPLKRAAIGGVLAGQELLDIATTLLGMRNLRRLIDSHEDVLPTLAGIVAELRTYPELEQRIHHCIDDHGKVTDRASEKLGGIRTKLKSQRDEVYKKLQRIMQVKSSAVQEAVVTQRDNRFVIPVKATYKGMIPGMVHDASASGSTLYIEPNSVVNGNNQLRQLLRQEQVEEERIRRQLSEAISEVVEDLESLVAIATTLDLATARARYSNWIQGNRPRFLKPLHESPEPIVLRKLRHPLLVWQEQHEEGFPVVPTNLRIDPKIRVVAITGPNTGGKTVTLKTLGLAALMAKAGIFVPASEPVELPWFDQILADIGDEQSLQQSLSTFSGHIKRIGRILDAVGENEQNGEDGLESAECSGSSSLVLLDEVGAGTDPSEGSALAIALLKHLADTTRLTVATTHFGELKALKYSDARFENASVEFDVQTLSPTYKLLWGIPGRSNALAIAQRLGLQQNIIESARQFVSPGASGEVNEVIAGLEAQRREQEEKAQEAARLVDEAEKFYKQVSRKAQLLQEREQELKAEQEKVVQAAIADAKSEIAGVIRQLQRGPKLAQRAQKATEAVDAIASEKLPTQPKRKAKKGYEPKLGERIRLTRLAGQVAEVVGLPNEEGELQVRFGIMKMAVMLADIESLHGEKGQMPEPKPKEQSQAKSQGQSQGQFQGKGKSKKKQEEPKKDPAIRTSRNTLDLRGSKVADAEIEIDRFMAESRSAAVWIIHGHGTGKLRRGVHEFLKQHHQVERFEAAEQADGGTGVTVVHLK